MPLHLQRTSLQLYLPSSSSVQYPPPSCSSEPDLQSPDSGFSSSDDSPFHSTRSSTLSPPSTPSTPRLSPRQNPLRHVHFADSVGLVLARSITFRREEERETEKESSTNPQHSRLVPSNFIYRTTSEYRYRARDASVCVTALKMNGDEVVGHILVLNRAFDKKVTVRWTDDEWDSYSEVEAGYGSTEDEGLDLFRFTLKIGRETKLCALCVCYTVDGEDFWDNNEGENYLIKEKEKEMKKEKGVDRACSLIKPPRPPPTRRHHRWGTPLESDDESDFSPYIARRKYF